MRSAALAAVIAVTLAVAACADKPEPTSPPSGDVGVVLGQSPIGRALDWSAHEIHFCASGGQLQSIYPLDGVGERILVGRTCGADSQDYQVWDLSSGAPVLEATINTGETGFNTGAHSPQGSEIGFAGEGRMLLVYDGSFHQVEVPCPDDCDIWDVWAASPTDVWVAAATDFVVGRIYYYDGASFTLEYEGVWPTSGGTIWSLWGFGGPNPTTMYAVGDVILERDKDGHWSEMPSPIPDACFNFLWDVKGRSPVDVWATSFGTCILHYDGQSWREMPVPAEACAFGGMWPLSASQIMVSGQCGVDLSEGRIAMWGSQDGGQTWTQVIDPAFIGLPNDLNVEYFEMAATRGGQAIFGPGIRGTLAYGQPGQSRPVVALAPFDLYGLRLNETESESTRAPVFLKE